MLSSPSRQISVLLLSSTRQFHPKFTLILFPQRCLGCFYSSQAVNVKIQTGNLAFVYPFKWMWLLNVHFKVSAGILIALRDGQDLDFLSIALDSSSISMTKKKVLLVMACCIFLCNSPKTSLPLSPPCLPAGWILSCSIPTEAKDWSWQKISGGWTDGGRDEKIEGIL